jgi:hexosaminidase
MNLLCYGVLFAATASAIWPIPSSYSHGDSVLWIDQSVQFTYNGAGQVSHVTVPLLNRDTTYQYQAHLGSYGHTGYQNVSSSERIVTNAIGRTLETLFKQNFVPWKFHPRFSKFEPDASAEKVLIKTIALRQNGTDPENILKPITGSVDESYALTVSDAGDVTISAVTSIGLAHGLTTFTQLFYESTEGCVYTTLAPVSITDAPKFPWRGLNLDTSRTFKSMDDIYRTIDALAYSKFNRLHWHITDSQAWPLELPSMPEVADKGAYIDFQKYSPADVYAVQEYGALVGVEVIMEIDQPGHTASIWFSHPELIAAFNVQPNWDTYAAEPPSGTLKLNSTAVYDFLETLFDDLLPRLKPLTSYFHLGGDEVNKNAYNLDDTVGSNESAVLQPLMQKFMDRNMQQITKAGFTPLVWEEMLLDWNLTLPSSTIVQSWQSDENVATIASKGYRVIAGNYNYWYLDCGSGQWLDFRPGASSEQFWPYNDYCSPRHNWRVMYSYDPLAGVPANETHLVIGGETHIWSEQTDSVNLDRMVWPRACAAAEVLWSGAKDASGQNRSQIDASPRLSEMRERLVARGVMAEPIQMPFCTMNGTQCAL